MESPQKYGHSPVIIRDLIKSKNIVLMDGIIGKFRVGVLELKGLRVVCEVAGVLCIQADLKEKYGEIAF